MQIDFRYLEEKYKFSRDVIEIFWEKYGQRTENIIQALKKPCKKYAIRVNTLKTTSRNILYLLNEMNIKAELNPILEEIIYLPVLGPFPVPEYPKKIVADKFAAESLIQGADLFAPGVLKASKIRVGNKITIIDRSGKIVASGIAEMNAGEMLQRKEGLAVKISDSPYKVFSIRESQVFNEGYIYDQSFPSILVSKILDPKPSDYILDMCAAPGGKVTHLAELMQNKGQIIAVDRSKPRIMRLKEHINRLGIKNIEILCGDSRKLPEKYCNFDKILIDPPCSALGVRPKLFDATTKTDIINVANYQRQF
ncbi:MAG: PUA domain-containing protein, partial [Promethearchaeota archaeon]